MPLIGGPVCFVGPEPLRADGEVERAVEGAVGGGAFVDREAGVRAGAGAQGVRGGHLEQSDGDAAHGEEWGGVRNR